MFKVRMEKLNKGWNVGFAMPDMDQAQQFMADISEQKKSDNGEAGSEERTSPRFQATVKRLADGSYFVTVYRSKLSEVQDLVKETFLTQRDQEEAGSTR